MAVGAASQRAAPVDPSRDPERHAHPCDRVAGARVTPAALRPVADPLAAAVESYRAALLGALPGEPADETVECLDDPSQAVAS